MVTKAITSAIVGINAYKIEVEVDVINSLPNISIVGLPDSSVNEAKEKVTSTLSTHVAEGFPIQILNPQGILLLGRSNEFTSQQRSDFELIKRQYKHIADIMTYDDLLSRLKNIITALSM